MASAMLVTLATDWVTDMAAITTESVRLKQSQDILDMDMVVMALAMPVILAMGDTVWVTEEDTTMVKWTKNGTKNQIMHSENVILVLVNK